MASKDPVLVVVELKGGNDFMNTIIPYTNGIYHDCRPIVGLREDEVLPMNDTLAWHPNTVPLKEMFEQGDVAIVQGIGYPDSSRSHFRAMDVWHTCEPIDIGTEGWLGRVVRDLDPRGENVLTGINFGKGLSRALAVSGVPITSVDDLDNYGLMTSIAEDPKRKQAIEIFKTMYEPAIGTGVVMDYLSQTGLDVIKGSDELKKAPAMYQSDVEYESNSIAKALRDVARVHLSGLGTRIFYTQHGGYDHHANEMPSHPKLLTELSEAIRDFFQDLRNHNASQEIVMLVFSEFGRRMRDNASGTDHGTGGGAFIIGDGVNGGLYAEYPSLDPSRWANGEDLEHTIDFRGIYATLLEQWMGMDATPIVDGTFEQIQPFKEAM